MAYSPVTEVQIEQLTRQGCTATDWQKVLFGEGFDPYRVHNCHFLGEVKIGSLVGSVQSSYGIDKPCGLYNATFVDCAIGDGVRISDVGVHIANYDIGAGVCIENVGTLQTNLGATFGNGVEVEVLNEAGGREVLLYDGLNAQTAYLMCLHRHRPDMIEKLEAMIHSHVDSIRSDRGTIGELTRISNIGEMVDVRVGPNATINGTSSLINATILSSSDAPAVIGDGVYLEDAIVAEGAEISGGSMVSTCFVGQGCRIGRQFSAENCLFFANSEGFHGEAVCVFAGPYTVTHHKSTLLIAGLFSFYNAGSGTNQSNHMYKLGPCHEGKVLRGCKTGSFSYLMWPVRVGPFSVVLGKHTSTFDVEDFPFSHLDARGDGNCAMVPGLHLTTVGTVRDGAKWPARDRRKGSKRDRIVFDVFSPYTVGRMIRGSERLKQIQDDTDRSVEEVSVGGAIVRRPILRTGQKHYRTGIAIYLHGKVVERMEKALQAGGNPNDSFASAEGSIAGDDWADVGGQLMPLPRLEAIWEGIESGDLASLMDVDAAFDKAYDAFGEDEWAWVKQAYKKVYEVDLDEAGTEDMLQAARELLKVKGKFLSLVTADAEKEFGEMSRCGFGADTDDAGRDKDFDEVRGLFDENKFVKEQRENIEQLKQQIEALEAKLSGSDS